jgi:hypothetical protein
VNLHRSHNRYAGNRRRMKLLLYDFLLLTSLSLTISSCSKIQTPTPHVRDLRIIDLLIGLSDMPKGWSVKIQPQQFREVGAFDAAEIAFVSSSEEPRNGASIGVYNYANTEEATRVFDRQYKVRVFGNIPTTWNNPQVSANQYTVGCYNREGREPYVCTWAAQYQEFVVLFDTWIIPEYMTFEDFEKVVVAIDNRMTLYLESPP